MLRRIPQPPVDPTRRSVERHDFWPGFAALAAGAILAFCGARHVTGLDTVEGNSAWEFQLVKAFHPGGLQYADQWPPPPPPKLDAAANPAEALDRWAKEQANAHPPPWKVRVNAGAETPCPT